MPESEFETKPEIGSETGDELAGYHYDGPLPLGSTVAHHCGAAGLFAVKSADLPNRTNEAAGSDTVIRLTGLEQDGRYTLTAEVGAVQKNFYGDVSPEGRRQLGRELLRFLRELQGLETEQDWGSLVGVRPMKLYHKLYDRLRAEELLSSKSGESNESGESGRSGETGEDTDSRVRRALSRDYDLTPAKADLLSTVAQVQRETVPSDQFGGLDENSRTDRSDETNQNSRTDRTIAVYGGIPFCTTRCIYCSFPYGLIQDYKRVKAFTEAFQEDCKQLAAMVKAYGLNTETLYMGGGTPTSPGEEAFSQLLTALALLHEEGREFTVEAGRPDTVSPVKLAAMDRAGVDRISINPQTLQDDILRTIGRGHTAESIGELYQYVRRHTRFSVNMDFIAGLPGQTIGHMAENLSAVCRWLPENVTIHTLALKKGSPLYEHSLRENLPTAEEVQEMVEMAREQLAAAGYKPYYLYRQQYMTGQLENVGYTLPGRACLYNIRMMEERIPVLSAGPGSASKWMRPPDYRQLKQHMPRDVDTYIDTLPALLEKRRSRCSEFWQ